MADALVAATSLQQHNDARAAEKAATPLTASQGAQDQLRSHPPGWTWWQWKQHEDHEEWKQETNKRKAAEITHTHQPASMSQDDRKCGNCNELHPSAEAALACGCTEQYIQLRQMRRRLETPAEEAAGQQRPDWVVQWLRAYDSKLGSSGGGGG